MSYARHADVFTMILLSIGIAHCDNGSTPVTDVPATDATNVMDVVQDTVSANDVVAPTDTSSGTDVIVTSDVPTGTCDPTASTCPQCDLGSATGMAAATGDTTSATDRQMASTDCGMSAGPDVTFAWRAPSAGSFVFDTMGTSHDTILYVRDASCGGTEVACNDDAPSATNGQSSVCVTATAGQMFVVVVDGYDSTARGPFTLNIASAASCP